MLIVVFGQIRASAAKTLPICWNIAVPPAKIKVIECYLSLAPAVFSCFLLWWNFFITLGSTLTDCSAHGTRWRAWGPRFESLFDPLAALFHGSNQPQSSASTVGVDNQSKLNLITC